jgi:alkylation response protein AidB-like acyl-CoA dehydrogenase
MDLSFSAEERAFADEAASWLAENLAALGLPDRFDSLDDEVAWGRAWQARLAAGRWVAIAWPADHGGRSATPVQVALYHMAYAASGAPQPVNRVGLNLAGPTLLAHGTDRQRRRWLPGILDASELWCQLFSEPDAGSDLASLRTVAEPVDAAGGEPGGPGWRVTGRKLWTSYAGHARWGLCLVRTDPGAARHRGLSYLVIDMAAAGVTVRPLRQITGEAEFGEVVLDGVVVPRDHLVGERHGGWSVANTTLAHERGTSFAFKEQAVHEAYLDELWRGAAASRRLADVELTDGLAQAFVELRLLRLHNWRTLSRLARGGEPGPESSWVKLAWTAMTQHLSAVALDVAGPAAPLWGRWPRQWLWSQAASIAGGTSEIQRTIIGERILGLPRERDGGDA